MPRLDYAALHFERSVRILAKLIKRRQAVDLDKVLKWAGVDVGIMPRKYRSPMGRLIRLAEKNPHSNHYHHPWHTMTVMMMAALLARNAKEHVNMMPLMISALVHDLDHRGRMMARRAYAEERRSAAIAGRLLYGRGSDGVAQRRLTSQLEATAFAVKHEPSKIDSATRLLMDADVLASCILPLDDALQISCGVRREQGQDVAAEKVFKNFLGKMANRGFAHPITSHLAGSMRASSLAIYLDPPSARILGFKR